MSHLTQINHIGRTGECVKQKDNGDYSLVTWSRATKYIEEFQVDIWLLKNCIGGVLAMEYKWVPNYIKE